MAKMHVYQKDGSSDIEHKNVISFQSIKNTDLDPESPVDKTACSVHFNRHTIFYPIPFQDTELLCHNFISTCDTRIPAKSFIRSNKIVVNSRFPPKPVWTS